MTSLYDNIIFGPIRSRRLGLSLGVNLLPIESKLCSFDCIYCECGWNADHVGKKRFNSREDVRTMLREVLTRMVSEGTPPDVITFAGNGEPTAHPHFAEIMEDTIYLRNKYFPNAKVSVLSNATMLHKPAVFEALKQVDNNILKLDTVDEAYIRLIDAPVGRYSLPAVIERRKAFEGHCIIQTMFLKGEYSGVDVNNTTDKYVLPWLQTVKEIAPSQVMIYTIDRETPVEGLLKASHEELDAIAEKVREAGINVSVSY